MPIWSNIIYDDILFHSWIGELWYIEKVTFKIHCKKKIKWEAAIRRKLQQMTLIFFNCHSALLRQEKTYDHFSNEDNEEDDEDEQDEDIMLLTMSGGSSASNLSQRKHVLNGTYNIYTIRYLIIWYLAPICCLIFLGITTWLIRLCDGLFFTDLSTSSEDEEEVLQKQRLNAKNPMFPQLWWSGWNFPSKRKPNFDARVL